MKRGKCFERGINIGKSQSPHRVSITPCYQPLAIMFDNVLFSFSPFGTIREICRLDGFPSFSIIFRLNDEALIFPKINLDLIVCCSFFIIMGQLTEI